MGKNIENWPNRETNIFLIFFACFYFRGKRLPKSEKSQKTEKIDFQFGNLKKQIEKNEEFHR